MLWRVVRFAVRGGGGGRERERKREREIEGAGPGVLKNKHSTHSFRYNFFGNTGILFKIRGIFELYAVARHLPPKEI